MDGHRRSEDDPEEARDEGRWDEPHGGKIPKHLREQPDERREVEDAEKAIFAALRDRQQKSRGAEHQRAGCDQSQQPGVGERLEELVVCVGRAAVVMREIEELFTAIVRKRRLVSHVADAKQRVVGEHRTREFRVRHALPAAARVAAAAHPVRQRFHKRFCKDGDADHTGQCEQREQPQPPHGQLTHLCELHADDEEEQGAHAGAEDRAEARREQDSAKKHARADDVGEAKRHHVAEQQHEADGIADGPEVTQFPALDSLHFADDDPVARAEEIHELNRRHRCERGEQNPDASPRLRQRRDRAGHHRHEGDFREKTRLGREATQEMSVSEFHPGGECREKTDRQENHDRGIERLIGGDLLFQNDPPHPSQQE